MTGIDWIGVGYAVSLAAGGIIGYASAKSVPSLVAGLTFGSMAAAGAYQTSTNPDVRLSFATSAIVMAVMGMRFINTGKWMPAGFIAGASLLLVLKHGFYMSIGKYD